MVAVVAVAAQGGNDPIYVVAQRQIGEYQNRVEAAAPYETDETNNFLEKKFTLLVGQSGMGKSKTVNALVLSDVARVGDLTASRDSGAHTTTFSRFYRLDRDTAIIDTPGFQSFGLFHLTEDQIGEAMREFRPYLGRCKFNDCSHLSEPGCEVIEASKRGEISRERLSFYQVLIEQHRDLHEQHPEWTR
mgnify:CR=1 FL=1